MLPAVHRRPHFTNPGVTDSTHICTPTTHRYNGFCEPSASLALQNTIASCVDDVASWMRSNRLQVNTAKSDMTFIVLSVLHYICKTQCSMKNYCLTYLYPVVCYRSVLSRVFVAVDKTSSSFSARGKIGNFISSSSSSSSSTLSSATDLPRLPFELALTKSRQPLKLKLKLKLPILPRAEKLELVLSTASKTRDNIDKDSKNSLSFVTSVLLILTSL